MPIIGSGTQGCIIRPALNGEPRMVSKIFVTDRGLLSQQTEVDTKLLDTLEQIDPERQQFAQALRRNDLKLDALVEVEQCKNILRSRNDVSQLAILQEIRWFNLDDLTEAPEQFTTAQKNHLRTALQMLHDAGYAHNDIQKPNIMIGSDELPRLIDFGETTLAEPARIQNDKDRLEALFRGSVLDINELRRSRIAEQRRQRDEELEDALGLTSRGSLDFGEDTPVPKRVRMSLFD